MHSNRNLNGWKVFIFYRLRLNSTPQYEEKLKACSEGILEAYNAYTKRTREKMASLPRGSKKWWRMAQSLSSKKEKTSSVPPLKRKDGTWAKTGEDKAELLLKTFCEKSGLPDKVTNSFSPLGPFAEARTSDFLVVRSRHATKVLK